MTASSKDLREIVAAARALIEQCLDTAEQMAALRDLATEKEFDWTQIKALVKAQGQDERNGKGRLKKLLDKAENASAYADMLGRGAEKKIFSEAA